VALKPQRKKGLDDGFAGRGQMLVRPRRKKLGRLASHAMEKIQREAVTKAWDGKKGRSDFFIQPGRAGRAGSRHTKKKKGAGGQLMKRGETSRAGCRSLKAASGRGKFQRVAGH